MILPSPESNNQVFILVKETVKHYRKSGASGRSRHLLSQVNDVRAEKQKLRNDD
jgi:hypothetical protein